jgi:hypothetical protein
MRKQLLQHLISEGGSVLPSGSADAPPHAENMKSFVSFFLSSPALLEGLVGLLSHNQAIDFADCVVTVGSHSEMLILLSRLLCSEFQKKHLKEKNSILRGSAFVDVFLVKVVKLTGTAYVEEVLKEFAQKHKPTSDVVSIAQELVECLTTSLAKVPPNLRVVFNMIRVECDKYGLNYQEMIGGLLLLRIFLPKLLSPAAYGMTEPGFVSNVTAVSSVLQKLANHKKFVDGDESVKYNAFIDSHADAFVDFFDQISNKKDLDIVEGKNFPISIQQRDECIL